MGGCQALFHVIDLLPSIYTKNLLINELEAITEFPLVSVKRVSKAFKLSEQNTAFKSKTQLGYMAS